MGWFGDSGWFDFAVVGMSAFMVLFFVVFFGIIAVFVWRLASAGRARAQAAAAPEVQAQGRVVDKRVETLGPGSARPALLASPNLVQVPMGDESAYQLHRITFEQPGGERFELSVPPDQYGLIVEGDSGTVTMKGGDLLSFTREVMR